MTQLIDPGLGSALPEQTRPLLGDDWLSRTDAWDAGLPGLTAADGPRPGTSPASRLPTHVSTATRAGLLLMGGADDASHAESQSAEGERDCDYWHGLMHRREPDYGNARYWFRLVGQHPSMENLPHDVDAVRRQMTDVEDPLGKDGWDAFAMITLCELAGRSEDSRLRLFTRAVQWAEMRRLLAHGLATGPN